MSKDNSVKKIERALLAREAFEILLKNRLKTSSLSDFCLINNIKLDELLKEVIKYRKGELKEKPSEKDLAKYHKLAMKQDRKILAKTCQVLYQRLIRSEMKTESLAVLTLKFGLGSVENAKKYANRYASREFADIGLAPTEEELKLEEQAYKVATDETKRKHDEIAKKAIEMVISTKDYKESIKYYAQLYDLSETTIKNYIRYYLKEGTFPKEKTEQFLAIRTKASEYVPDRTNTALKAKEIFQHFKKNNFDFTDSKELCKKYDIQDGQIRALFNQYIRCEFAYLGVLPSEEDVASYNKYLTSKNEMPEQKRVKLGKLAYETLMNNEYNKSSLKPICTENGIKLNTLLGYLHSYRRRIIDPKPSKEEEEKFVKLMKAKQATSFKKDSEELIGIMLDFITSDDYYFDKTLQRHGYAKNYNKTSFESAINNSDNPNVLSLYEEVKAMDKRRAEEFASILLSIQEPKTLLDLQLAFKISLEDIRHMVRHLVKYELIRRTSAEDLLRKAGLLQDQQKITNEEDLNKFSCNYKGQEIDFETKKRIYNYLLSLGVVDINSRIITTYFQRIVNNQATLPISYE